MSPFDQGTQCGALLMGGGILMAMSVGDLPNSGPEKEVALAALGAILLILALYRYSSRTQEGGE